MGLAGWAAADLLHGGTASELAGTADASRAGPASSTTQVLISAPHGCARGGCNCPASVTSVITASSSGVSTSAVGV